MRLKHLGITVFLTVSCGQEEQGLVKSKVGAGVLRPFDSDGDPSIEPAIGKLDNQCTVFHIGDGIVASAGHCFDSNTQEGSPCISQQIQWQDGSKSQCIQVLDYALTEDKDYAIFEVDPAPRGHFELAQNLSNVTQEVSILGYPSGQALQVSEDCKASFEADQTSIKHNCPTLPGHSGSPILDPVSLQVLGIHNGNYSQDQNYGTVFPILKDSWEQVREERGQYLNWGPFENNRSQLLYHIPTKLGHEATFTMSFSLEDGYDFVFVQDGNQVKQQITGSGVKTFTLTTPVIISFESDYGGESEMVELESIEI